MKHFSPEHRKKISDTLKRKYKSGEIKVTRVFGRKSNENQKKALMLGHLPEARKKATINMVKTRKKRNNFKHTEDTKSKMSKSNHSSDPEISKKISESVKKAYLDGRLKCNIIKRIQKGQTYEDFYGEEKSNVIKEKRKIILEEKVYSKMRGISMVDRVGKEKAKKISDNHSEIMKRWWKENPEKAIEIHSKMLKSRYLTPNKFETKVINICNNNKFDFRYVGDGKFWLEYNGKRKNPDFINEKEKIIIEVFCSYFKKKVFGNVENYMLSCRKVYENNGWDVVFLDENDIKNQELCANKIRDIKAGIKYE